LLKPSNLPNRIKLKTNFLFFTVLPGALGLLLSWLYPGISLTGFILPALILVLIPHFIDLHYAVIRDTLRNIKPILLIAVVGFLLAPLWTYLISHSLLEGTPTYVIVGFTLFAITPGNVLAPIFTQMRQGDTKLPVLFYAVSYLFALVLVPVWSQLLLGRLIPIPVAVIVRAFLLVIGVPLLITRILRFTVLRRATEEQKERFKGYLQKIGPCGLAFIFFSIFAERGELLLTHPTLVLKVLPAAALLLLACLVSGLLLSRLWGLPLATTEAVMITAATKNTCLFVVTSGIGVVAMP